MTTAVRRGAIESTIRIYFEGCNEANRDKILSCLAPQAVHYFPAGSPFGVFRGAQAIADGWKDCVERLDSRWTVDRLVIDPDANEAVIEWTHFKPRSGAHLRGAEWYRFDEQGRIVELRAYYACPTHEGTSVHELGGFDYAGRGYATEAPGVAGRGPASGARGGHG